MASSNESIYRYSPLPTTTTFRILELLPITFPTSDRTLDSYGPGNAINKGRLDANELSIRLHVVEFQNPPSYEAISYRWGGKTHRSHCDGSALWISQNLRDALLRFRFPDKSRFLWADAICIDQTNSKEKGHQVKHMRQIYQNAKMVLVWLGSSSQDPHEKYEADVVCIDQTNSKEKSRQVKNMRQFYQNAKMALARRGQSLQGHHEQDAANALKYIASELTSNGSAVANLRDIEDLWGHVPNIPSSSLFWHDFRPALRWFFSHDWFSRIWMFQEVTASPNVTVFFGKYQVSWDLVALAANLFLRYPNRLQISVDDPCFYIAQASLMRRKHHHKEWNILHALHEARKFDATDHRDKLYAMLGLPAFITLNVPVEPDYDKTLPQTCQDIVFLAFDALRTTDVFSHVFHSSATLLDDAEYATWAPRWHGTTPPVLANLKTANAGAKSVVTFSPGIGGRSVKVMGLRLGIVKDVIATESLDGWFYSQHEKKGWGRDRKSQYQIESNHPLKRIWLSHFDEADTRIVNLSFMMRYALCITAGMDSNGHAARDTMEAFGKDFKAYMLGLLGKRLKEGEGVVPSALRFSLLARVHTNRILFHSSNGWVGLGPQIMKEGDIICIFFGGKVPYILRPIDNHFQLIGECYIHEIMNGEAIDQWNQGFIEANTFELI